jgi:pimeloyl-ACP methyl ester carboxylesterase
MPLAHIRRGSGPPLVLIHGIGSQWQMWRPVLDRVSREREVVALDLPGFGGSAALTAPPTVEALAASVAGFLDEIGLGGAHVAGNSLGGAVALEMARAGSARSACLLCPAGFANSREGTFARAVLVGSRRVAQRLDPVAEVAQGGPLRRTLTSWHLSARPWRIPADEAAGALRNLARSPGFDATLDAVVDHRFDAQPVQCPVTVAWGEKDRLLIYSRQSARARRLLPDGRHVTLTGCGHVPTWDDPDQVARVVLEASSDGRG